MIYIVADSAGNILRSGLCPDSDAALEQAQSGEVVLVSESSDVTFIDDVNINIVGGDLAPVGSFSSMDVPVLSLEIL